LNLKKYIAELKRRNVFKSAVAYLIIAWLLVQVLSIVLPTFDVSLSFLKTAIILLIIGFPIWLIFSWVFELTPEGLKKTDTIETDKSIAAKTNVKLNRVIIGALSIAVILLIVNQFRMSDSNTAKIAELAKVDNRKSIAVLPFSNISPEDDNAFFTEGMHEDVLNKLGSLRDLKVISRTSVLGYRDYEGDLKEVGNRLGVRYIVEGTVSRWENEIKVTTKLIDATTNESLWSNSYSGELKNVFKLQSDIAQEIVEALKSKITQEELVNLNSILTENTEAYDAYLRARNIMNSSWYNYDQLMEAIGYLNNAVKLDKNFVAGWSLLSIAQSDRYGRVKEAEDDKEAKIAKAQAELALNKTKELQPSGFYYLRADGYYQNIVKEDKIKAFKSLDSALEIFPNDAETLFYLSQIYMYLGQFDDLVDTLETAYAIDNQNGMVIYFLTFAYELTHRYEDMVPFLERLMELEPENTNYLLQSKYYQFLADGKLESFHVYENVVKKADKKVKLDNRNIVNHDMVVAMFNNDYNSYTEAWKGKWDQHHKGHGKWSCPLQINDETNQANLMIKNGNSDLAFEIIERAKQTKEMPYNKEAFCIFNKSTYNPKLEYMTGNIDLARKQFEEIIPKILNNNSFPRGAVERSILLETADLVAPDRVYSIYKQVTSNPVSLVSMETICANPWIYPNLIKDPSFIKEVKEDGRFVNFLVHYNLMAKS
jgi:TolB-like protein